MQVQHIGHRIRGFYGIAQLGHLWEMTPKDTPQRLRILQFFETHGLAATVDAFGVSRRTLYRWKRALREGGGNPAALAAKSCAPKRKRTPKPDPRLIAEIRRLRGLHPNRGKAKRHALLKPWCAAQDLALPSVSTIGRIIARAPDKMRHTPCRLLKPLQVLACDTIERIRDGLRRYLVTFTDPASRLAFALPSKHARPTARALEQVLTLWPHAPHTLLSDNGSEFQADFAKTLQQYSIRRWYTYPKSPKMNAHAERFNRTLQESFVNYHEAPLFTDFHLFNQKLADWLIFYNTERPHHSLGLQSPVSFLIQHQPERQRYWTHTYG